MSNPEVKIRLSLDGAQQVQAGVEQSAEKLLKLEKASADVASAQARLEVATQKAAAAQAALAKASNFPNTAPQYLTDLQTKVTTATAAMQQAAVRSKEAQAALAALGQGAGAAGQKVQLSGNQISQVSAQLQDFFIQVQGGQAPLTAFLQQGSQMSAVFGGVGNAARAMLSLLTPAVVGMGLLGGALIAVGVGYAKGSAEAQEFNRTLLLSGNAIGVTTTKLTEMAAAIRYAGGGTQSRASEILNEMAGSGKVATENLQRFTAAALQLERVGGPAAEETARAFAKLADSPAQAALKLNESTNFLTASTYKQIASLVELGKTTEAAKIAQEAYATALEQRTPGLEKNLGSIEHLWLNIKDAAKAAGDVILDIGRKETLQTISSQVEMLEKRRSALAGGNADQKTQAVLLEAQLEPLRAQLVAFREIETWTLRGAAAQQQQAEATKATADAQALLKQYGIEINSVTAREVALREALVKGGIDQLTIEKAIAAFREQNKDKGTPGNAFAGEQASAEQWARAYEEFSRAAGEANAQLQGLTKSEAALQALRNKGLAGVPPGLVTMVEARAQDAIAAEKAAKAYKEVNDAYQKHVDLLTRGADQAADQVLKMEEEEKAAKLAAGGFFSLAQSIQLVAIARLEEQMAGEKKAGNQETVDALQKEIEKRKQLVYLIGTQETRKFTEDANKELDKLFDPSRALSFGDALSGAFAQAGNSLGKLSSALQAYEGTQRAIAERQLSIDNATDPAKKMREQAKLNEASQRATIGLYANMAGAAKGFFSEGSKGYKTLQLAETAFTAYQLANDIARGTSAATVGVATQAAGDPYTAWARMAAMAATMASLGYQVAGFFGGGQSSGGDGAKQATGTGTVLGDATAKSESLSKSMQMLADTAKLQLTTQSGMLAALKSIESSIGGLAGLLVRSGNYSGDVAAQFGIATGTTISKGLELSIGGPTGLRALGNAIPIIGKINAALFGSTTKITGNGIFAGPQSLGGVLSGGLNLQDYADVNSKSKFFGITYSNKNSTQYQASDPVLKQQFGLVFQSFADALKLASVPLGASLDEVVGRINTFTVDIGKIDLKDLTGTQIQEKLSAVLGAAGDSIASTVLPGLNDFQKVGEGYLQTVIRVASGVETATASLDLLGIQAIKFSDVLQKQGDVGAEIVRQSITAFESLDGSLSGVGSIIDSLSGSAEELAQAYKQLDDARDVLIAVGKSGDTLTAAMLRGAGGLENLQSSLGTYFDKFLSDEEKAAAKRAQLSADFAKIGVSGTFADRKEFKNFVSGIDTTTEAGQKFFAQVIGLAGAFDEAMTATEKLAGGVSTLKDVLKTQAATQAGLQVELLTAQGNAAGAAALKRQQDLAGITANMSAEDAAAATAAYDLTESLRAQIKATQEAANTAKTEAERIKNQRDSLEAKLADLQGGTAAMRERELAALDASNRAIQLQIYALQDQQAAADKAAEALQAVTDKMTGLGDTRFDLENQLLTLGGQDSEVLRRVRERDLARLTAGVTADEAARLTAAYDLNVSLQKEIDQTKAAQQAAEAIAKAQEQAAETAARAAEEQQRAAEQVKNAWQSASDTLFTEAARIRGLTTADSPASLASAQASFAMANAAAKAGDQDAVKKLPELARLVVELGKNQAGSQLELDRLRAAVAASLESTGLQLSSTYGLNVPKLATGTNYVPRDMLAFLHEGEQVTPKAYNPAAGGGAASDELVREVKALREQVARLEATGGRTANATERARDILTNVTENGKAMQVETAS